MALIIQKFGGTSVADRVCLYNVANIIARRIKEGYQVVTVVSAQGDDTDHLYAKAVEISPQPNPRELDALLSSGEQISASLLAITLSSMNIPAISLTGSQAGILTNQTYGNAEIIDIKPECIRKHLDEGKTVIVTGFQGADKEGNTTTLGRGGSDTSAVALAAYLNANICRIYKDVDGIYSTDPRKDLTAEKYDKLTYDQMLKIVDNGSQVLQRRSVEFAKEHRIELQILSSFQHTPGTIIC